MLDIRTQRLIQGVEANVNIRGTLSKPEIVLTSTPPLEQADILSLIVFNQPINSLGEGQQISLAQRAQGLAAGAVAGELAKSIGNALNLDTFDIQMAPDSGATAQVTIGQQVGQNLFVKVQQDVGDQSSTNFILEYQLKEWLRLQSNFLQGSSTQTVAVPPRAGQRRGSDLLVQLLRAGAHELRVRLQADLQGRLKPARTRPYRDHAVASDATCTRASLKHAPPPMSVSVSGTSAVPVKPFRVLRRHNPFGRLIVPGRIDRPRRPPRSAPRRDR